MLITVPTKSLARLRWIQIASIAFCAFAYSKMDKDFSSVPVENSITYQKEYYVVFKSNTYELAKIYPKSLS